MMIRRVTNIKKIELEIYRLDEIGERQNGAVCGVDSVMWTIISINRKQPWIHREQKRNIIHGFVSNALLNNHQRPKIGCVANLNRWN